MCKQIEGVLGRTPSAPRRCADAVTQICQVAAAAAAAGDGDDGGVRLAARRRQSRRAATGRGVAAALPSVVVPSVSRGRPASRRRRDRRDNAPKYSSIDDRLARIRRLGGAVSGLRLSASSTTRCYCPARHDTSSPPSRVSLRHRR